MNERTNEQAGGSGAGLGPLVDFYSKLPKGAATTRVSGIKGRYFDGANASGKPIVALIVAIFGISYTIDYNSASYPFLPAMYLTDGVCVF